MRHITRFSNDLFYGSLRRVLGGGRAIALLLGRYDAAFGSGRASRAARLAQGSDNCALRQKMQSTADCRSAAREKSAAFTPLEALGAHRAGTRTSPVPLHSLNPEKPHQRHRYRCPPSDRGDSSSVRGSALCPSPVRGDTGGPGSPRRPRCRGVLGTLRSRELRIYGWQLKFYELQLRLVMELFECD